jgi:hypothetical protein
MALRRGVRLGAVLSARNQKWKIIPLFLLLCSAMTATQAITLQWDPNRETDLAGYKVYYGETSSSFVMANAGKTNSYTLNSLTPGKTYNFYVTAYNTAGLESNPSQSISYTVPQPQSSTVRLSWAAATASSLKEYQVSIKKLSSTSGFTRFTTTNTYFDISNLSSGEPYYILTRAVAADGSDCELYRQLGPVFPPGATTLWVPKVPAAYSTFDADIGGNWISHYGSKGFLIASEPNRASAVFGAITNGTYWVWENPSNSPLAQQTSDGTRQVAACWYSDTTMSLPINLNDNQIHLLSVYCMDFEGKNIEEYIQIVGSDGWADWPVFIGSYANRGVYVTFLFKGPAVLTVKPRSGSTYASFSGVYLD